MLNTSSSSARMSAASSSGREAMCSLNLRTESGLDFHTLLKGFAAYTAGAKAVVTMSNAAMREKNIFLFFMDVFSFRFTVL